MQIHACKDRKWSRKCWMENGKWKIGNMKRKAVTANTADTAISPSHHITISWLGGVAIYTHQPNKFSDPFQIWWCYCCGCCQRFYYCNLWNFKQIFTFRLGFERYLIFCSSTRNQKTITHSLTHTYIYIYIYI